MQPYAAADAAVAAKRADAYNQYMGQQAGLAAQNYYNTGANYANLGNNWFNALAGQSEQAYIAPQFQTQNNQLGNTLAGAGTGAAAGAALGWPGMAVGGLLGGLGGFFGS